jgi:2-(1,2-epoxy-1,2-dihydrophenyl)acetyl-CoA isomerase
VVPHAQLIEEAIAAASQIAFNPTDLLVAAKRMIWQNLDEGDIAAVQERELAASADAFTSPEFKEAVQAFIEKRQPDFHGK